MHKKVISLFLKTIPKSLNILVVASILILILKIFYLNHVNEIFKGAHELGIIIEGLLGSIVASYIFYLIVVHLSELRKKLLIYPYIIKWAKIIVGTCRSQLNEISKATNVQINLDNLSQNQVVTAMQNLNPYNQAPLIVNLPNDYANWLQFLHYNIERTKSYIHKITSQILYIEAELISLIIDIEECSYFYVVRSAISHPIKNNNLCFLARNFFEYCQKCKKLDEYINKHPMNNKNG